MIKSFNNLKLKENIIKGLEKLNITVPTDIQIESIPMLLKGKDFVATSQTGSGKTLAYLLPLFQKIDIQKKESQVIILAPTYELCSQINNEIKSLSANSDMDIKSALIIGDVNIKRQIEKLKEKPHIIVGSCGRVLELIKKKKLTAHTIKTIVMDEGDKLLDKTNFQTVRDIVKSTLKERQLVLFSATVDEKAIDRARTIMKSPKTIKITEKTIVNPNIEHLYFKIDDKRDTIEILRKLIASTKENKGIVFINKNEEAELVYLKLKHHSIKAYALCGNVTKEQRKKAIDNFKSGKINILVASDIAARGLDIKDLSYVFNLDLPKDPKEYLHRAGRCGRGSNMGTCMSIVTLKELSILKKYEKTFDISIDEKYIYKGSITNQKPFKKNVKTISKKNKNSKFKKHN